MVTCKEKIFTCNVLKWQNTETKPLEKTVLSRDLLYTQLNVAFICKTLRYFVPNRPKKGLLLFDT